MLMVTLLIIQRSVECRTDHFGESLWKARQETTWKSCVDWLPIDSAPLELKGAILHCVAQSTTGIAFLLFPRPAFSKPCALRSVPSRSKETRGIGRAVGR